MIRAVASALEVTDACLSYGTNTALSGVSFDLRAGELLGLLGPNGAGKTTLINCLAGRQQLDSGKIHIGLTGERSDVMGIVPQEIAVYPDLTVRQNLRVFGELHGLRGRELRNAITEALAWSRLEDRHKSQVQTLSGGMQRRLNIACSVLHQPRILLLDEPAVGVDPQSRECIYAMLGSLLEAGTAVLLTTHQLDEAQTLCDRIAIIDNGQLIDSGTFDELLQRTIGTSQEISVRFTTPPTSVPAPLQLTQSGLEAFGLVDDAVNEVTRVMQGLKQQQASIEHFTLREPTLQHLFLHLTGKELRE